MKSKLKAIEEDAGYGVMPDSSVLSDVPTKMANTDKDG